MNRRIDHLYLHVPFCTSICAYCDFCHRLFDEQIADRWLDRLEREIKDNCAGFYETIYIGGGTPTSLTLEQLERLFRMIRPYAKKVKEYTIEANPESLDEEKILVMKSYGINRISIGIQSSDDDLLKLLNRRHSFEDAKEKISLCKKNGLDNISVDLMYSLPTQTMKMLEKTIQDILELDVVHISIYSLTIEDNTIFKAKGYEPLDIELEADMYEYVIKVLEENGYRQYEVSNFAKKGYESRHNIGYWHYDDFLGLSLHASSKVGCLRWTNTASFREYFSKEDLKQDIVGLNKKDEMFENIMMSLRLKEGLDIARFNKKYSCDLVKEYPEAMKNPHIEIRNGYLICDNLAILDDVLLDFME